MRQWMMLQIGMNAIWMLELISDLCVKGVRNAYKRQFRVWPETICQILFVYCVYLYYLARSATDYYQYNLLMKYFQVIIFVRLLRLLTLLYEVRVTRLIVETAKNMVIPLTYMFCVLMIVFYYFAFLGMYLFGGLVKRNMSVLRNDLAIPDNYHLLNFNDIISANVTLWALLFENNWNLLVDMFCGIRGYDPSYRYYFVLFWYFSAIIGVNLFVAFVLDMYASVERLEDEKEKTINMITTEM